MLAGVGGGGEPMVSDALLFSVPTVAVMVTVAATAFALKVTVATPEALVDAVPAEKLPDAALLTVNVTLTPLIAAAAASLTVADTVILPGGKGIDGELSETTIEAGVWTGVPMVMRALPLIVVVPTATLARMVAVVFAVVAVNTLVATPDAFVTAEDGVSVPAVALIAEKITLMFGITIELASLTIAVTVEVPPLAIDAAENDTWTVVGVGVGVGVGVVLPPEAAGLLKSVPQPHTRIARNRIIVTTRLFLILPLPTCRSNLLKKSKVFLISASIEISIHDESGSQPHCHNRSIV